MPAPELEPVHQHLECIGYDVICSEDDMLEAHHHTKPNIRVQEYAGGLLIMSAFAGRRQSDAGESIDDAERLGYANELNATASVCRYYFSDDWNLFIEAWSPAYERRHFSELMEAWDRDLRKFAHHAGGNTYLS